VAVFTKEFPSNHFVVDSSTEIGPAIGQKLQQDALIAVLISFAGIIFYVAARFELRFGIAAALATFHDVLAVLGSFYILDKEITLLVVTALLTLAAIR
jgi:preprotein translocase subunit SecF